VGADDNPDSLPIHTSHELVALAILLREIYMKRPLESLAAAPNLDRSKIYEINNEDLRFDMAVTAFKRCKAEFPDN
jgi:hypothetical protein